MLAFSRSLFAFLLTLALGVFVYFHFHGAVSSLTSSVQSVFKQTPGGGVYKVAVGDNGKALALPSLPDLSKFTVENVESMAPSYLPGKVLVRDMVGVPALREFIKKDGRVQRLRVAQLEVLPKAIVIEEGRYDFTRLYEAVKKQGFDKAIEKTGDKYLLRLPILVGEKASLVLSGRDAEELRLSQEQSVFIANAGELFILRTKVTGWSEKENKPALFREKTVYRPYLVNWSGGRLHIAGSTLASLGYRKGKSYGLSYSSCEPCLFVNPRLAPPTGIIVGSTFSDMYFGFYSYEAEDVAIVGNVYKDNIVYGIDPHDRSRRLIIAHNEAYGSKKKHGIIISRSVNDSWIFKNNAHHNHGSGIMLDRTSENNVVAGNVAAYNKGDGITLFESQNNTLYNNQVYKNAFSGIRIRNSWNVRLINDQIADNGGVPVVIYTAKLEDSHKERDFVLDPYTQKAGAEVSGMVIKLVEPKPAFKLDGAERVALSNVHLLSGGAIFADHLFSDERELAKNIGLAGKVAVVESKLGKVE